MIRLRSIKPNRNPFDDRVYRRAIKGALDNVTNQVKADFDKTVATWDGKPGFDVVSPSEFVRVVGTDDENYQRQDEGTRPHVIVAHGKALAFGPGGSPKTRPRVIGSSSGSKGSGVVFTKRVNHPGTTARVFAATIAEKWEPLLGVQMQAALDGVE